MIKLNQWSKYVSLGNQWVGAIGSNLVISVCGFFTGIIIARELNPEGRGLLTQAQVWIPICISVIGVFNMQTVNFIIGTASTAREREHLMTELLFAAILQFMGACLACFIIIWISFHDTPTLLAYSCINLWQIPPLILGGVYAGYFLAMQRLQCYWKNRILIAIAFLLLISGLAICNSLNVLNVSLATISTTYLGAAGLAWNYHREHPLQLTTNLSELRVKFLTCWKSTVSGIPSQFNSKVGPLALTYLATEKEVGVFTVAQSFAGITLLAGGSLSTVFITRSTKSLVSHTENELLGTAHKTTFALTFLGGTLALASPFLLPRLFGNAYADSILTSAILCLAFVAQSINLIANEICRGFGRTDIGLQAECLIIALTVGGVIAFRENISPIIISFILLIAYGFGFLHYQTKLRREMQNNY